MSDKKRRELTIGCMELAGKTLTPLDVFQSMDQSRADGFVTLRSSWGVFYLEIHGGVLMFLHGEHGVIGNPMSSGLFNALVSHEVATLISPLDHVRTRGVARHPDQGLKIPLGQLAMSVAHANDLGLLDLTHQKVTAGWAKFHVLLERNPNRYHVWEPAHRRFVVGRHPACELVLDDPSISERHSMLFVSGNAVMIEDMESSNGTFVGERRIVAEAVAQSCWLRFGTMWVYYEKTPAQTEHRVKSSMTPTTRLPLPGQH